MTEAASSIFQIASRISTPLALAGLSLAVLFLLFRQLLALGVFPKLTRAVGGDLLKHIVDRLFFLALAAMILGFVGYIAGRVWLPARTELPPSASAEKFLNELYSGDYKKVYDSLSTAVTDRIPFSSFVNSTKVEMSQFSGPPRHRRARQPQRMADFYVITFEAEFDERSRFREVLTYAGQQDGWILVRFEISPEDWPLSEYAALLTQQSAKALLDLVSGMPVKGRASFIADQVRGHWIPRPGWTGRVNSIVAQKATRTCDIKLEEQTSGLTILARDVLDGCRLEPGQTIHMFGRLDTFDSQMAEISSIRYSM